MSPRDAEDLSRWMAERCARGERISPLDLTHLSRVLELTPEDMTATVQSGIALGALQSELAKHGQWLPIDPPNAATVSIHELLARNLSGPRRFGYGTIREHLIGMKVVLADGRLIKSGGRVVKNVAGYDLAKLFIGARDSLGVIVEATFKLRPLPDVEQFVCATARPDAVGQRLRAVLDSPLTPVVLDVHRVPSAGTSTHAASDATVVIGFAGTREEVEWQLSEARQLGFVARTSLEYESAFWNAGAPAHCVSVLPSQLGHTIADLGLRAFVARAGNGVVHYRGDALLRSKEPLPAELMRRVKHAYDPKNILPEFIA